MQVFSVNAFTHQAYTGNPAAVCIVPKAIAKVITTDDMQCIAVELNLAETVFLLPCAVPGCEFQLRWFTREMEVSFCGHATLAAGHIILSQQLQKQSITFASKTGPVTVSVDSTEKQRLYSIHLKPTAPTSDNVAAWRLADMAAALSLPGGVHSIEHVLAHRSGHNLILVLRTATDVIGATLNKTALVDASPPGIQKVTITARWPEHCPPIHPPTRGRAYPRNSGDNLPFDTVSRLFAPWIGIDEDAVSGATHAVLAHYWASVDATLKEKATTSSLLCYQSSPRGGVMRVSLRGDRAVVSGAAVTITSGTLCAPLPSKL